MNPRPPRCERGALPTELVAQTSFDSTIEIRRVRTSRIASYCHEIEFIDHHNLYAALHAAAQAQSVTPLCTPQITANQLVATATQRAEAGAIAEPPITDHANGFAWPDTPLGVVKTAGGYAFFGSDGGLHSRQFWQGNWYGNNKYGSVTRSTGTLDSPVGSAPPIDVSIQPNPDTPVNPFYQSYDYMGGGPVYQVPAGMVGAGNLLMVYHAEIPTITTPSFYAVLALAASTDSGASWTDLGEIIRINQA